MSLFDTVLCKAKLPDDAPSFLKDCPSFQTYDLGGTMADYEITADGTLILVSTVLSGMLAAAFGGKKVVPVPVNYRRKRIELHASNLCGGAPSKEGYVKFTQDGEDAMDITYVVQIRDGKVSSIKEKWRRVDAAMPISKM